MIAGLVLAGGQSRRFGSEKAVVRLDDRTLLEWALEALRGDCDALAISAPTGSGAAVIARDLGLRVLADDPAHPDGPLAGVAAGLRASPRHDKTIPDALREAVAHGARLRCGGRIPPRLKRGTFYEPTILTHVTHDMEVVKTETFGPVMPIMRVRDIDHAIACANDSTFGLGANLYTNNMEWAMKAMERITAGTFWINDPLTDNDAGPFGGMRQTGHCRELGEEGLDAFRETKHVHLDYKQEVKPYWYPYAKYNTGG